jgi:hypothetical protein
MPDGAPVFIQPVLIPVSLDEGMKIFVPYTEEFGGKLMDELGLNLGDLVPFQLDYECLRLGEEFCEAEIHGPREAWEGLDD